MEGLSKREVQIIAWLEFYKKYFFTVDDVAQFFTSKTQRYNTIKRLVRKKRIVKLNKKKYYLVPIKAKSGSWTERSFILVDEICDGKDYVIGMWNAANYWQLTDQIPFQVDVFTTRRQGTYKILNTRIVFHRATRKKIDRAVVERIGDHTFRIQYKSESKQWVKFID